MANRGMTFMVPEDVAEEFSRAVPDAEQSHIVATALRKDLWSRMTESEREEMIKAACEAANNDPETQEIQREMAALPDTMTEEWNDAIKLPQAG